MQKERPKTRSGKETIFIGVIPHKVVLCIQGRRLILPQKPTPGTVLNLPKPVQSKSELYKFAPSDELQTAVALWHSTLKKPLPCWESSGFVVFSLVMFAIAAPVYWFFLFKNLRRSEASPPGPEPIGL